MNPISTDDQAEWRAPSWVVKQQLNVLYVEDSEPDAELGIHALQAAGFEVRADITGNQDDFERLLPANRYDVILADYQLVSWSGMDALTILRKQERDIPFILISGALGEVKAVECIRCGATDYVLKDCLARLPFAVSRALEEKKLRDERRKAQGALAEKTRELEKSHAELEQFAAMVSHELAIKETLLQELHHRVKNNLQIVSSLLNLQAETLESPVALLALRQAEARIRSMAFIHERLYQSNNLANVDCEDYVRSITDLIVQSYDNLSPGVCLESHITSVPLHMDRAILVGLILHELVSNAFIHAFPDSRAGRIEVSLAPRGTWMVLKVRDSGIGLPPDDELRSPRSLGLKLVTLLTGQLKGTLQIHREKGTEFVVSFPQTVQKSSTDSARLPEAAVRAAGVTSQ